jgi:hypothetical protein
MGQIGRKEQTAVLASSAWDVCFGTGGNLTRVAIMGAERTSDWPGMLLPLATHLRQPVDCRQWRDPTHAGRAGPASEQRNLTITQSSGSRSAWPEPPHSLWIIGRLPNTTERTRPAGRPPIGLGGGTRGEVSHAAEAGLWGLDRHE